MDVAKAAPVDLEGLRQGNGDRFKLALAALVDGSDIKMRNPPAQLLAVA